MVFKDTLLRDNNWQMDTPQRQALGQDGGGKLVGPGAALGWLVPFPIVNEGVECSAQGGCICYRLEVRVQAEGVVLSLTLAATGNQLTVHVQNCLIGA